MSNMGASTSSVTGVIYFWWDALKCMHGANPDQLCLQPAQDFTVSLYMHCKDHISGVLGTRNKRSKQRLLKSCVKLCKMESCSAYQIIERWFHVLWSNQSGWHVVDDNMELEAFCYDTWQCTTHWDPTSAVWHWPLSYKQVTTFI